MYSLGLAIVYLLGIAIVYSLGIAIVHALVSAGHAYYGCYPQFRDERSINVVILREPYATQASNRVRGRVRGSTVCRTGLEPQASRQGPSQICCSHVRALPWTAAACPRRKRVRKRP